MLITDSPGWYATSRVVLGHKLMSESECSNSQTCVRVLSCDAEC